MIVRLRSMSELRKGGGPYIGPKGGLYADPAHTIPWRREKHGKITPKNCPRCKGVAHVISRQTTMGGSDVITSAPCRTCNKGGKHSLDEKRAQKLGLPVPKESKRRSKAPPEPEQAAKPRQMKLNFRKPQQTSLFSKAHKLEGSAEYQDLDIAIEQKKGSKRHWIDPETRAKGTTVMVHPYGYIRGYKGADGEEVDVFLGPDKGARFVYVINQRRMRDKRRFDEHKVMLGFNSEKEAKQAYLKHYDKHGPSLLGSIRTWSMDRFLRWLKSGKKTQPVRKADIGPASDMAHVQHRPQQLDLGFVGGPDANADSHAHDRMRVIAVFGQEESARAFIANIGRSDLLVRPVNQVDSRDRVATDGMLEGWYVLEPVVTSLMAKAGPYVGPRGGLYEDPQHKRPWRREKFTNEDKAKIDPRLSRWNEQAYILDPVKMSDLDVNPRPFFERTERRHINLGGGKLSTDKHEIRHRYHVGIEKGTNRAHLVEVSEHPKHGVTAGAVGEYYRDEFVGGNILGILESRRGKGIGSRFVAAAAHELKDYRPSEGYSPAGIATRKRAYDHLEKLAARGEASPREKLIAKLYKMSDEEQTKNTGKILKEALAAGIPSEDISKILSTAKRLRGTSK